MHELEIKMRQNNFIPTAEIIKRYYNNRKIVLYGDSIPLRRLLKDSYGIKVANVATAIEANVNGTRRNIRDFFGKSDEYYIVAPFLNPDEKQKIFLDSMGYKEFKDFVFTRHKRIESDNGFKDYHDEYGNSINAPEGLRVIVDSPAGNVKIDIHDSVRFEKPNLLIVSESNSRIVIKKNCSFKTDAKIHAYGNAELDIGENCSFVFENRFYVPYSCKITLGNNCMFSSYIKLYSGDGHAVFDVETGKRTLDITENSPRTSIVLEDHVWVGLNAMLLGNTHIGRSSIVGAGAVVKGKFPNNCAVAGNPAKIVKKNVTWTDNVFEMDIKNCGEENIALTGQ